MTPLRIFSISSLFLVISVFVSAYLATMTPVLDLELSQTELGIKVVYVKAQSLNSKQVKAGDRLVAFRNLDGNAQKFHSATLMEEPDQLPEFVDYFALMQQQSTLTDTLLQGTLSVRLSGGQWETLKTKARHISDLPFQFWYQGVFIPASCFLIALSVWVFRRRQLAARFYLVAAIGVAVSAQCAAIYGVRELAIDGEIFRVLSLINHLGAMLFTAAFFGLIWVFPERLGGMLFVWLSFLLMLTAWLADIFKLTEDTSIVFYLPVLLVFVPTFFTAWLQWRASQDSPVKRASLKWFLLSLFLGTTLYAVVMLLPPALNLQPVASQASMFTVFLFMFVGLALGIVRYRLFDLDRWWLKFWIWALGGLGVILVDVLLVAGLKFEQDGAIILSLALLGWLYFPLRQYIWHKLAPALSLEQKLSRLVKLVLTTDSAKSLSDRWPEIVKDQFSALTIETGTGPGVPGEITQDAQTLTVATLSGEGSFKLSYPDNGGRLFRSEDLETLNLVFNIVSHAYQSALQRDQIIHDERQRIMQDLHDDLGSKLLSLIYTSSESEVQALSRSALQDMRDILSDLQAEPYTLETSIDNWCEELQSRTRSLSIGWQLEQDSHLPLSTILSARQNSNVSRILREVITNALKHNQATAFSLKFVSSQEGVCILLITETGDQGNESPDLWQKGRGLRGIERRALQIDASISWSCDENYLEFCLDLPLG